MGLGFGTEISAMGAIDHWFGLTGSAPVMRLSMIADWFDRV